MSHQVKICETIFDDLDILTKAITEEGLTLTDRVQGYGTSWNKGQNYNGLGKSQVIVGGLTTSTGKHLNCGVVKNTDNTYEIVGDTWGVTYRQHGLPELGSRLGQRYGLEKVKRIAKAKGWSVMEMPNELLAYGSKEKARIVVQPAKQTVQVGTMV